MYKSNNYHQASMVQWKNARLPRGRPGFDSRSMHIAVALVLTTTTFAFIGLASMSPAMAGSPCQANSTVASVKPYRA
ncbi:hypothetical protein OUZ56_010253 [Daphnia magna]|uniref:Uncharacterized protein n=1 Tax=Daphnia magna TaxID=35525 RepID=A0ABR0AI56_9CRUS|nr:hypothetical protein OUZ56_010253 [Daphnia magna]